MVAHQHKFVCFLVVLVESTFSAYPHIAIVCGIKATYDITVVKVFQVVLASDTSEHVYVVNAVIRAYPQLVVLSGEDAQHIVGGEH